MWGCRSWLFYFALPATTREAKKKMKKITACERRVVVNARNRWSPRPQPFDIDIDLKFRCAEGVGYCPHPRSGHALVCAVGGVMVCASASLCGDRQLGSCDVFPIIHTRTNTAKT
ncbi:unnamed protein product [Pylaiella littoralis]